MLLTFLCKNMRDKLNFKQNGQHTRNKKKKNRKIKTNVIVAKWFADNIWQNTNEQPNIKYN